MPRSRTARLLVALAALALSIPVLVEADGPDAGAGSAGPAALALGRSVPRTSSSPGHPEGGPRSHAEGDAHAARRRAPRALRTLDPRSHRVEDGTVIADLEQGQMAILSLDPGLQHHVEAIFDQYEVPWGALVAMDPMTGRVLAYVSHSSAEPGGVDLVRDASAPAASVFKIITGAALLEAGVGPEQRVCYHGGESRLALDHLVSDPRRDTVCATLEEAMGGSINAVFARLSVAHLGPAALTRHVSAFGFGEPLPFDVPTTAGAVEVPADRLEFARTSAGFWHSHLSPLHAALIASTVAADGAMPRASIVDSVLDAEGHVVYEQRPEAHRQVVPRRTARALNRMMRRTVSRGTARRAFHDERGVPFLPGIEIAGKTGTLSAERPFRGYTWWVGFAPADHPTIALASLVINRPEWRIKASYVAREALRHWLVERPRLQRVAAR